MKTPPKDGTMILAKFRGEPTPLAAMWNSAEQEWAVAVPYKNAFFETEGYSETELESWKPIGEPK